MMRFFMSGAPQNPSPSSPREGATPDLVTDGSDRASGQASATFSAAAPSGIQRSGRLVEVVTPLNALVGFSGLLADADETLTSEQRHAYGARVRESAEQLQRMLSTLVQTLEGKGLELSEDWISSGTFKVAPAVTPPSDAPPSLGYVRRPEVPSVAPTGHPPRVFVVDADESNRELLAELLASRGYELVLFGSGADALRHAEREPPDLVLIDPSMTSEDGFALAQNLKASNPSGFVPLVLVSALVDEESRMRALDAGAEQMVRKPVNRHELRARVKSLLLQRAQREELAVQNAQLKSLQRFKDETTAMLVHDLKSPLSAMMMNLDFALDDLPTRSEMEDIRSALAESRVAGAKLFRIIANLLDVARSDDGRLVPKRAPVDVGALFTRVIANHVAEANARRVTIAADVRVNRSLDVDPDLLARVLSNLIENALRYTHAGGSIVLGAHDLSPASLPSSAEGDGNGTAGAVLTVTNEGRPLSPELRALVFDKYPNIGASQVANRGLGLYFCRVAVEAHGGRIELDGDSSATTCFRIHLP